jgi:hypothetical protein
VPDVALVQRQTERTLPAVAGRESGDEIGVLDDLLFEIERLGNDRVVLRGAVHVLGRGAVQMEGEVVDHGADGTHHCLGPAVAIVGEPYSDELQLRIDGSHEARVFGGVRGVGLGGAVPHLPAAVDFVAQSPVLHAVRLRVTVASALSRVVGVACVVRVLDPADRVVDVAAAVRKVGLGSNLVAPGKELVGAEAVRLLRSPRQFQPARSRVPRPSS